MLKIKNVTLKNFLSIGAVTQVVSIDNNVLTLILGENLDLGGGTAGSRNGVGKSSLLNAITYALYGSPLTKIKQDNLINHANAKGMMVTLDFDVGENSYRIERGRKPNIFKFFINNEEAKDDESQGENRNTQAQINTIVGMSIDMFRHVVALNTYTEPFLSMGASPQREIIEQLLGITKLSEKSTSLKEEIKNTKAAITIEETKIAAIEHSNKAIQDTIASLKLKQKHWLLKKDQDIERLSQSILDLQDIDIDSEIANHHALEEYTQRKSRIDAINKDIATQARQEATIVASIAQIGDQLTKTLDKKCHACGQDLHSELHEKQLAQLENQLEIKSLDVGKLRASLDSLKANLAAIPALNTKPSTYYRTLTEALNHKNSLDNLMNQLETKSEETDMYADQISELESNAVQIINMDVLNELHKLKEHQDFLLKLLTNKDSFIRKKIIDQNLNYLNSRLAHYLTQIGLPHSVKFQSDLSVEIKTLGMDLDFDNLSRGERNRLILSLSWAFRDVWENLYQSINFLAIDELIDSGLDQLGSEQTLAILKKMARERNKSIWLISHKDEIAQRVDDVLLAVKEGGFTSYCKGN